MYKETVIIVLVSAIITLVAYIIDSIAKAAAVKKELKLYKDMAIGVAKIMHHYPHQAQLFQQDYFFDEREVEQLTYAFFYGQKDIEGAMRLRVCEKMANEMLKHPEAFKVEFTKRYGRFGPEYSARGKIYIFTPTE